MQRTACSLTSHVHFHPEIKRTVNSELPDEDKTDGEDQVGELLKTMYGTRDASAEREGFYSEVVEGAGAKTGLFSPCLFSQEQTKLKAWAHGDDMCLEGKRGDTRALESKLKKRIFDQTPNRTWMGQTDDQKISPLNRLIDLRVGMVNACRYLKRIRDMCRLRHTIWVLFRISTQDETKSYREHVKYLKRMSWKVCAK